jgi:hypothetical protein
MIYEIDHSSLSTFPYDISIFQENEVKAPKPGGKVWIRRRMCRFADNKIQVKDHQHVRHHIVDDIPDFDSTVQKQKRVMQAFL